MQASSEKLKAVLCFSSVFYNVTNTVYETRTYSTTQASTTVLGTNGQSIDVCIHLDTCGSKNLASEHLLLDIKKVEKYGHDQIYMVTVNGNSPAYTRMGELHSQMGTRTPSSRYVTCKINPSKGLRISC